jgi:hypothetical protein
MTLTFSKILGYEVIEYWTIFSLKIHLHQNKKIIGEFGHSLGIIWKPLVSEI